MVDVESPATGSDLACPSCKRVFKSPAHVRTHFAHRHFEEAMAAMDGTGAVQLTPGFFEFPGAHKMGTFTPLRRNKGLVVLPLMLGFVCAYILPLPINYIAAALALPLGLLAAWFMAAAKETQQCLRVVEYNEKQIWQLDWIDRRDMYERDNDGKLVLDENDEPVSVLPESCWHDAGRKRIPVLDTSQPDRSRSFQAYVNETGMSDTVVASKIEHSDSLALQVRPLPITAAAALRLGGMILITGIFAVVDYLLFQSIVDFNTAQQALAAAR